MHLTSPLSKESIVLLPAVLLYEDNQNHRSEKATEQRTTEVCSTKGSEEVAIFVSVINRLHLIALKRIQAMSKKPAI